jgi:TusA-related sulfurtransferase
MERIFQGGSRLKRACDHLLDLKGAESPLTLLRVIEAFKAMKTKETLEVLGSDPDTRTGIFKVLRASSYHLISEEELPGDGPRFRIRIRKERDTPVPDPIVE